MSSFVRAPSRRPRPDRSRSGSPAWVSYQETIGFLTVLGSHTPDRELRFSAAPAFRNDARAGTWDGMVGSTTEPRRSGRIPYVAATILGLLTGYVWGPLT